MSRRKIMISLSPPIKPAAHARFPVGTRSSEKHGGRPRDANMPQLSVLFVPRFPPRVFYRVGNAPSIESSQLYIFSPWRNWLSLSSVLFGDVPSDWLNKEWLIEILQRNNWNTWPEYTSILNTMRSLSIGDFLNAPFTE